MDINEELKELLEKAKIEPELCGILGFAFVASLLVNNDKDNYKDKGEIN